jgi:hypothetical protein
MFGAGDPAPSIDLPSPLKRPEKVMARGPSASHSDRSATTGSTRAALAAGIK